MVTDPRFFPKDGRAGDAAASFSLEERDRRWSAVRAAMDARGLDCLIIVGRGMNGNGDARWLDGGDYGERSMVFPKRGAPVTFWLLQNWGKWYTESCFEGVRYRGHEGKVSIVASDAVKELGYERARIGIVGLIGGGYGAEGAIPYMPYQNLKRLLPDAAFADASDILTRFPMTPLCANAASLLGMSTPPSVLWSACFPNIPRMLGYVHGLPPAAWCRGRRRACPRMPVAPPLPSPLGSQHRHKAPHR